MSISCNSLSKLDESSNIPSIDSSYSSFSFVNFSIFAFPSFISFSSLSISLLLPKILTVFFATDPPVIAPDAFITSPSFVTILNEYLFSFATLIPVSILSTITVLPKRL